MKRLLTFCLFLLAFTFLQAQTDRRLWSQGPLTWNDFTIMPASFGQRSYLQYGIGYNPVRDTLDGVRCCYYRAVSWMQPSSSWVPEDHRDSNTLRYNQIIFDMLEVERRQLQLSINANPNEIAYSDMLRAASSNLSSRIESFSLLSQDGADTAVLSAFERQVAAELAQYFADYHPRYTARPFGYGLYVGIGVTGSTGSMGKAFSPGAGLNFGFDFSYNRHLLILDGTLGLCKARQTFSLVDPDGTVNTFPEGKLGGLLTINLGYGYTLVDNLRWQLSPFVALGIREFSYSSQNQNNSFDYARPEPVVGLQFRRHFWHQYAFPEYNYLAGGDRRVSELSRVSLQGRLLLSYSSFPDLQGSPTGLSIQAQVALSLNGRLFNVD